MKINSAARSTTIASMAADADREKMTHKQVEYQDSGKGDQECQSCRYFVEPGGNVAGGTACALVRSPIHRDGWCRYWHPKDEASALSASTVAGGPRAGY